MDGSYITDVETKEQVRLGLGKIEVESGKDGESLWMFTSCCGNDAFWRGAIDGILAWLNSAIESGAEVEATSSDASGRAYGRVLDAREMDCGVGCICVAVVMRVERMVDRAKFASVSEGFWAGFDKDGVWRPEDHPNQRAWWREDAPTIETAAAMDEI